MSKTLNLRMAKRRKQKGILKYNPAIESLQNRPHFLYYHSALTKRTIKINLKDFDKQKPIDLDPSLPFRID